MHRVCGVFLKCFPHFLRGASPQHISSSLVESFCIWTHNTSPVFVQKSVEGVLHAHTVLVLINLYLSWKHVFCLFMLLLIGCFFKKKTWYSVEVIYHAPQILCCIEKRWLYMLINYWWIQNKSNELFFCGWF